MTENFASGNKLENLYLRWFKFAIVAFMTLALLGIAVVIPIAAYNLMQRPTPPVPARQPPAQSISIEDLKKFLIEEEKRRQEQEKGGAPARSTASPAQVTQRYAENSMALYRCAEEFSRLAEQPTDTSSEFEIAQRNERVRAGIENLSGDPYRGPAWVGPMVEFVCAVLGSPEMAKLKKDKVVGAVVLPTVSFHAKAWSAIERGKQEFRESEARRVASEIAAEEARVAGARLRALTLLGIAGGCLGAFLLLALYLIFAKIEDNLRLLYVTVRQHQSEPVLLPPAQVQPALAAGD